MEVASFLANDTKQLQTTLTTTKQTTLTSQQLVPIASKALHEVHHTHMQHMVPILLTVAVGFTQTFDL